MNLAEAKKIGEKLAKIPPKKSSGQGSNSRPELISSDPVYVRPEPMSQQAEVAREKDRDNSKKPKEWVNPRSPSSTTQYGLPDLNKLTEEEKQKAGIK